MIENRSCTRGLTSIYYEFKGKSDDLVYYFKHVNFVDTFNEITNVSSAGVYALVQEENITIRIVGKCPNFKTGSCKLDQKCIKG